MWVTLINFEEGAGSSSVLERVDFADERCRVTHNDALGQCSPEFDDSGRQADAKII